MALDLTNGKPPSPLRKSEPLPDDWVGGAAKCAIVFAATDSSVDLEQNVHDLLLQMGLTQIGVSTTPDREITSTLYQEYPYIIVNRTRERSGNVEVDVTFNRDNLDEFQSWSGALCANAQSSCKLSFQYSRSVHRPETDQSCK